MTIPGWFLWAEAYLFVKMFELWVLSDIPFDFFDYFSPFRDEQFRCLRLPDTHTGSGTVRP